jgi:hypothetical protein
MPSSEYTHVLTRAILRRREFISWVNNDRDVQEMGPMGGTQRRLMRVQSADEHEECGTRWDSAWTISH